MFSLWHAEMNKYLCVIHYEYRGQFMISRYGDSLCVVKTCVLPQFLGALGG
jgi:hypothetical protein